MDLIFKALADATRRQLLDRLFAEQGQTLGQLCGGTDMRRQSVSKHLNILEGADLVSVVWRGREKYYYLNPVPLTEISTRWIDKFSRDRAEAVLRLKQALEDPGRQTQGEGAPNEDT